MKKNIFTASFILVFTFLHFNTNAQSVLSYGGNTPNINTPKLDIDKKFFVHIGLAFNTATLYSTANGGKITSSNGGKEVDNTSSGTNLNLGISYLLKIGKKINFEPGIFYTPVGSNISVDFLKIPANFNLNLNKIDVLAGPTISIPISKSNSPSFDYNTVFGLNLGLGYNINDFKISAIYNLPFTKYIEYDTTVPLLNSFAGIVKTTYSSDISSFNILLSYKF